MGTGAINCCEANSSTLDEMSMQSPRNGRASSRLKILSEVSQSKSPGDQERFENNNRLLKLKSLVNTAKLQIKVVNSGPIQKDTRFYITHLGLEDSKRRANDGKVYFGYKRKERGIIMNDVVIPVQDKDVEDHHRGRHFMIQYQIENNSYIIKDLGKGFGVYSRLDFPIVRFIKIIKDNMIINMGSMFLAFTQIVYDKKPVLNVKVMGEERGSLCFDAEEYEDKVITIGRGIACDIRLDDHLLSKVHATVYFNRDGWNITDGDLQKKSTNSTWLYLSDEFEIYTAMIFKCNQSVFQVTSLSNSS